MMSARAPRTVTWDLVGLSDEIFSFIKVVLEVSDAENWSGCIFGVEDILLMSSPSIMYWKVHYRIDIAALFARHQSQY